MWRSWPGSCCHSSERRRWGTHGTQSGGSTSKRRPRWLCLNQFYLCPKQRVALHFEPEHVVWYRCMLLVPDTRILHLEWVTFLKHLHTASMWTYKCTNVINQYASLGNNCNNTLLQDNLATLLMNNHITLFVGYCAFPAVSYSQINCTFKLSKATWCCNIWYWPHFSFISLSIQEVSPWAIKMYIFLISDCWNQNGGNSSSGGANRMQEMWISRSKIVKLILSA